jgi:hypothetical protein
MPIFALRILRLTRFVWNRAHHVRWGILSTVVFMAGLVVADVVSGVIFATLSDVEGFRDMVSPDWLLSNGLVLVISGVALVGFSVRIRKDIAEHRRLHPGFMKTLDRVEDILTHLSGPARLGRTVLLSFGLAFVFLNLIALRNALFGVFPFLVPHHPEGAPPMPLLVFFGTIWVLHMGTIWIFKGKGALGSTLHTQWVLLKAIPVSLKASLQKNVALLLTQSRVVVEQEVALQNARKAGVELDEALPEGRSPPVRRRL